jgi:hypothetical protein
MGSNLYRLTCSIDSVLAAGSADEAIAFARAQQHEIHVEQLEGPEALIGLNPDEAVVVLAALHRVGELNGQVGRDSVSVIELIHRLEDAIALIDHQASLHVGVASSA